MYIVFGVLIFSVVGILLLAKYFSPNSEMMEGFEGNSFKKIIIALSTTSVLMIGYGVYFQLTYQPPFIEVHMKGKDYIVVGEIGKLGYFTSDQDVIRKNKETHLYLVSWHPLPEKELNLTVTYDSNKEEHWKPIVKKMKFDDRGQGVKQIYELSPFTFKEMGKVVISFPKRHSNELIMEVFDQDYEIKINENKGKNPLEDQF